MAATKLIVEGGFYAFEGTREDPDRAVLAIDIARGWAGGSPLSDDPDDGNADAIARGVLINENLMLRYGLPNGQARQSIESANAFFQHIYTLVCLLNKTGAFRNSPEILALGFDGATSHHPEIEICRAVNASYAADGALPELVFEGGKFASRVIPSRSMMAEAYAGVADIASSNGADMFGLCALKKCGKVFRMPTKRASYCRASHRVMDAQLAAELRKAQGK